MAEQQILAPANRDGLALSVPSQPITTLPLASYGWLPSPIRGLSSDKLVASGILGGSLILSVAAWAALNQPTMVPLYTGLNEADRASIAEQLDATNQAYELDQRSGAIEVPEEDVQRVRMELAGKGLPKSAPDGAAILDGLTMGASQGREATALQSAREADLARTIEGMDAVKTARVHVASPTPSPFVRDSAPITASVMVQLENGRTLDNGQIDSIRYLTASSIPGLTPANVSVVDQSGNLLSDEARRAENENQRIQKAAEERYRSAIFALLTPMLGKDAFSTEVHVDMDFTESQATRERYPENESVLRAEQVSKRPVPGAQMAGGIPGANSNQPPPESQLTNEDPGATDLNGTGQLAVAEDYQRNFDLGREISVTHTPVGRVNRISVAVAVRQPGNKPLTAAQLQKIERLVQGATGYNPERGDIVTVEQAPFVDNKVEPPAFYEMPWFFSLLRQVGAILVALFVLFLIARPALRKLKAEKTENGANVAGALENGTNEAQQVDELLKLSSQEDQEAGTGKITPEMIKAAPTPQMRNELLRHYVKQDKSRAALVVRELIKEKQNG